MESRTLPSICGPPRVRPTDESYEHLDPKARSDARDLVAVGVRGREGLVEDLDPLAGFCLGHVASGTACRRLKFVKGRRPRCLQALTSSVIAALVPP